jgi:CelD/BcsL family acetyltransferase involved in cellulose biosynthesis
MVSIHVSEGRQAIQTIADEWDALVEGSFTTTFSRPAWFLAWLDAVPPKRFAVVTARSQDRLVGVLPLARTRTDAKGLFFALTGPLGRADYQPPIVHPDAAALALPAMLDAGFRFFGRSGVFRWPNIPAADPSLPLLRSYFAKHGMLCSETRETAPRIRFTEDSYSAAEQAWSPNLRNDVRRRRRRLAEKGPLSLWIPPTLPEAEKALVTYFQVHDDKWLSEGYPGRFQNPAERKRYQSLLRRFWDRGVHFSTLRCGSTDVSYHFGFLTDGWLQWYRPTYRLEFASFSPSKVHVSMLVEEGYRARWKGFDFLLGEEPYKIKWSNEAIDVVSIHAGFGAWSPSYLWFTEGRPFVRQRMVKTYTRVKAWAQRYRQHRSKAEA